MLTGKLGRHMGMERIGRERLFRGGGPDLSFRCVSFSSLTREGWVVEHSDSEVFSELVVCDSCQ